MPAKGEIPPARFRQLSQVAAVAVMGAGVSVLFGWWRDIDFLKSVIPGTNSMKVNTAVCFVLAGLSLWLLRHEGEGLIRSDRRGRLGQALALIVILIAGLSLSQDLLGWNLGIDELVIHDPSTIGVPGRIAARTSLAFILLGITLLLLDVRTAKGAWPAQLPAALGGWIGFGGVVGHAYSAVPLFRLGSLSVMAANTSVALVFLAVGILLARPQRGMTRILTREGPGGSLARWLLPAAVLVPFAFGWLRLAGQSAGLYDTGMGTALYALVMIAILTGLIYRSAVVLDRLAEQRQKAEDELKRFFSISMDLLCVAGTDGYFKVVNPRWEKVLGYSQQELLSQPYLEFIHPEDREATHQEAAKQAEGHDVISFENRYRCRDGSYRWFNWTATAVTERGVIYAAARDVTERKQTDQRIQELNRELGYKLEELAAVNQELEGFSYSVAHDLRAPLRHVDGFSKILLEDHGADMKEEARVLLERVREGAQHMGALIDELLNFSRLGRQEPRRQITGLNSIVEEARTGLRTEGNGRAVEWRVGRLPFADCDPALMKQVFSNLLANALKFTRPREQTVIEVGQFASQGQTVIFVRDNGVGFDMKYADKLFGVFQRLHRPEDFEGTGVGLALVQKIVQKHGGRIWVEASLDRGATFFFTLGAAEPAPQPTGAQTGGAHGG
jgi:PAS domain S-box-containing protein